jgi:hypothetical protein
LSLKKPFIIEYITQYYGDKITYKIVTYENGAYIQWNGWMPFYKSECVGMPVSLTEINKPVIITINSKEEKKIFYNYRRNKLIFRGLLVGATLLIGYLLRNTIVIVGNRFLLEMDFYPLWNILFR